MAEQENVSAPESFDNPGPSTRETSMEGKNLSSTELVQAIVADQGFITQLSSAIMAQMAPQLRSVNTHNTAVLQGQADGSQSPAEYLKIKREHKRSLCPEFHMSKRAQMNNQIPPYPKIGRVQLNVHEHMLSTWTLMNAQPQQNDFVTREMLHSNSRLITS